MERVILGLGSNKGDKTKHLKNAVDSLSLILKDPICSSIYKTAPQDYEHQDDFFNMVVIGWCDASPQSLLKAINEIEKENGRNRCEEIPKGPRTLDIDILFFGNITLTTAKLTLPHPAIKKRAFVLVPLLELLPDFIEPNGIKPYKEILTYLKEQKVEKVGKLMRN